MVTFIYFIPQLLAAAKAKHNTFLSNRYRPGAIFSYLPGIIITIDTTTQISGHYHLNRGHLGQHRINTQLISSVA